jgi:hypothetical protein
MQLKWITAVEDEVRADGWQLGREESDSANKIIFNTDCFLHQELAK